jgi:glycerol kinase
MHAMMGDRYAGLYGNGIRASGIVKAACGTGSSIIALTPGRSPAQICVLTGRCIRKASRLEHDSPA